MFYTGLKLGAEWHWPATAPPPPLLNHAPAGSATVRLVRGRVRVRVRVRVKVRVSVRVGVSVRLAKPESDERGLE